MQLPLSRICVPLRHELYRNISLLLPSSPVSQRPKSARNKLVKKERSLSRAGSSCCVCASMSMHGLSACVFSLVVYVSLKKDHHFFQENNLPRYRLIKRRSANPAIPRLRKTYSYRGVISARHRLLAVVLLLFHVRNVRLDVVVVKDLGIPLAQVSSYRQTASIFRRAHIIIFQVSTGRSASLKLQSNFSFATGSSVGSWYGVR